MSGNSSGGVAVTGESSSGGRSLPVNVLGNGFGGASASGQASACAGEERPSLFSDSGNHLPIFNPFAAAMATLGPAERYESLSVAFGSSLWLKPLAQVAISVQTLVGR